MKAVSYLAEVVVVEEEEEVLCFHIHCEHVFRYFGLLVPTDLTSQSHLTIDVPNEGYSRHVSCAPN